MLLYLVTPFVPSEIACLASSPGRMRRTAVWISRDEMVDFLLYEASLDASPAILSKISLTKELEVNKEIDQHTANGGTGKKIEVILTSGSS